MTAIGPGTRVVCIIGARRWTPPFSVWLRFGNSGPKHGSRWTVTKVYEIEGVYYLRLSEWPAPVVFSANGFRPIDDELERLREIARKPEKPPARRKAFATPV